MSNHNRFASRAYTLNDWGLATVEWNRRQQEMADERSVKDAELIARGHAKYVNGELVPLLVTWRIRWRTFNGMEGILDPLTIDPQATGEDGAQAIADWLNKRQLDRFHWITSEGLRP